MRGLPRPQPFLALIPYDWYVLPCDRKYDSYDTFSCKFPNVIDQVSQPIYINEIGLISLAGFLFQLASSEAFHVEVRRYLYHTPYHRKNDFYGMSPIPKRHRCKFLKQLLHNWDMFRLTCRISSSRPPPSRVFHVHGLSSALARCHLCWRVTFSVVRHCRKVRCQSRFVVRELVQARVEHVAQSLQWSTRSCNTARHVSSSQIKGVVVVVVVL